MKTILCFLTALCALSTAAQVPPYVHSPMTTNTSSGSPVDGQNPVYSATDNSWHYGAASTTGAARPLLTSGLTLFVATTGNDSNPGTNISSPLLTIQAAVNKALAYDFTTNNITVQIANGAYSGSVLAKGQVATADWKEQGGFLILHGNDASPTSVVITNSTTNHLVMASMGTRMLVQSLDLGSTNKMNESLLDSQFFSYLGFSNVVMGPCGVNEAQLVAEANGTIEANGPYTVTAGGSAHALALGNGTIYIEQTATFTGTPVYSYSFARACNSGALFMTGPFNGTVTAPKYALSTGGTISTYGQGSADTILAGSSDGIQNLTGAEGSLTRSALSTTLIITNVLNSNVDVDSIRFEKYGNDLNGPSVSAFHSRGTTAGSQGALLQDDRMFFVGGGGSDGTALQTNRAMMSYNADGTWSGSSTPTYVLFQTTGSGQTVRSNSFRINSDHTIATYGFNGLVPGNISVTASPMTYTTSGGHSEFVYINGGAVASVTLNGTLVASGTNTCITVNLQNGESAVITYSVAPTSIKRKPY